MFYYLQLQFLNMDQLSLLDIFSGLKYSDIYIKNKFTKKFEALFEKMDDLTKEEMECLATHLAVQLSGMERWKCGY